MKEDDLYQSPEDKRRLMAMSVLDREKELTRRHEVMTDQRQNQVIKRIASTKKMKNQGEEDSAESESKGSDDDSVSDDDANQSSPEPEESEVESPSEESSEWEEETQQNRTRIKRAKPPTKKPQLFQDDKTERKNHEKGEEKLEREAQKIRAKEDKHSKEREEARNLKLKKISKVFPDLHKILEACRITKRQATYFLEHPRAAHFFDNALLLISPENGINTDIGRILSIEKSNSGNTIFRCALNEDSDKVRAITLDQISDEPLSSTHVQDYKMALKNNSLEDLSRLLDFLIKDSKAKIEVIRDFTFTDADVATMLKEKGSSNHASHSQTPNARPKTNETKQLQERKTKLEMQRERITIKLKDSECTAQRRVEHREALKNIEAELENINKQLEPRQVKVQAVKGPVNLGNLPPLAPRRHTTTVTTEPVDAGTYNFLKRIMARPENAASLESVWSSESVLKAAEMCLSEEE